MIEPLTRLAIAAMGTRFELAIAGGGASLRAAGEAAVEEIEIWHRRLSRFEADSLVSHIVRTAAERPVRLDRDTFELFAEAERIRAASGGAFDVALGGGDAIALDEAAWTIAFRRPGVALDLGGLAKGHALDRAAALLREHGVRAALLHGGTSSIVAVGAPPGTAGWRVAVGSGPGARVVTLCDAAMSVSDAGAQQDAGAESHIVDPRSGRLVVPGGYVAVVGPSARTADAWSTALVVLGGAPASFDAGYVWYAGRDVRPAIPASSL